MESGARWNTFYSSGTREPFLHLSDDQLTLILKGFPNIKTALDIGCGEGQLMMQLESRGISTMGIDVSNVALDEARKHINGTLIEADFEQYTFQKESQFDLIFTKFVIAFIKDINVFFKKVDSLLKPGGGFILLTPVIKSEEDRHSDGEDIFIEQSALDTFLPKYFCTIQEEILHAEDNKKLALYVCTKAS